MTFTATFGGLFRTTLCAENFADDNIIDSQTDTSMKRLGVEHKVENLIQPRELEMAASLPDGKTSVLKCTKILTIDMELGFGHGSSLTIRGVRWLVPHQTAGEPLLGRPVLEFLN